MDTQTQHKQVKQALTGNESIARGFYEAGGFLAASYPGSPTVELLEAIKQYQQGYTEWSPNEKVALEVAMGASMSGARALVSMKHVGLNIALDPLMTFTQTQVSGGFVIMVGDDPGMKSSQNEQDSRVLAKYANMPVLMPSSSAKAKEYTKLAFQLSEKFQTPVMLYMNSRQCHSRGPVKLENPQDINISGYTPDISNHAMIPPYTIPKQQEMQSRIANLTNYAETASINQLEEIEGSNTLIITTGLMYQNLQEVSPKASVLKLGMAYPLPIQMIEELASKYQQVLVLEELMPVIEDELKTKGIQCDGKKYFNFTGELLTSDISSGLEKAGVISKDQKHSGKESSEHAKQAVPERSPIMCAGCPHRPVFDILKKSGMKVVGDIGCYSLGLLPPFEVSKINISMGASMGIVKGMRKAFNELDQKEPLVALIGDGTLYHSGLSGLVNLAKNTDKTDNITVIVLDNSTTAMTGGQATPSTGRQIKSSESNLDIQEVLQSLGFDRVTKVDQFDYQTTKDIFEQETSYEGLSAVITSRPCALKFKIKEPHFYVNPNVCIGCRNCVKTNCPPIKMTEYPNQDKLKSFIDPDVCVGCSVCSQVCPVEAIRRVRGGVQDDS
ncbi:thiamine pyrophosphate-dependent enzyme [Natranaerobius thermophilus]|uniref:Indolepyruvate oxidoreductase subunit IorA n=1 Tax=Natranaerobius thermophilus (strain ATCC BAA-1301 / DSM 18059 / JW/NM-WN-LF) TaxID=457570 RepID=B2A2V8_NATTJ|nr:thiamine pyrophosphate-dependent enzyme [Natranaerobius thermophilus]ACB86326.1 Indolepyruvate ferredoxin oxidoreductase [Natranaerobius thermophilus JW/NM-WN-LF]